MDSFIQPGAFPYYCKKPMWSTEQAVKDEVLVPHRTRHSQGSYSSRHRDVRDVFKVGSCTPSKNEVARVHSLTSHKTPSFYSDSLFPRRRPEHSSYFNVPAGSQLSLPSDSRRKESLTNTTHSLPSSSQQCYDNRAYSADIHEPVSEESSSTDSNSAINDDRRNNVPAQITVQYVSARTSHFHRTTNETNSNLLLPSAEPPRGKPKQYQFQGQLRTPRSYTQHGTAWPNFSDGGGTSSQEDIQLDIIGPDDRRTVSDDAPKKKPCLSVTGWKVLALLFMLITLCLTAAIVAIILGFVKPDNQAVSSIQTTGKPDEVDVVTFNGSMRIRNMTYGPEYEDKTSQKYKSTSVLFCSKVQAVYNNSDLKDSFQTCQVIAYRNGSIYIDFVLTFVNDSKVSGTTFKAADVETVFNVSIESAMRKENMSVDMSSLRMKLINIRSMLRKDYGKSKIVPKTSLKTTLSPKPTMSIRTHATPLLPSLKTAGRSTARTTTVATTLRASLNMRTTTNHELPTKSTPLSTTRHSTSSTSASTLTLPAQTTSHIEGTTVVDSLTSTGITTTTSPVLTTSADIKTSTEESSTTSTDVDSSASRDPTSVITSSSVGTGSMVTTQATEQTTLSKCHLPENYNKTFQHFGDCSVFYACFKSLLSSNSYEYVQIPCPYGLMYSSEVGGCVTCDPTVCSNCSVPTTQGRPHPDGGGDEDDNDVVFTTQLAGSTTPTAADATMVTETSMEYVSSTTPATTRVTEQLTTSKNDYCKNNPDDKHESKSDCTNFRTCFPKPWSNDWIIQTVPCPQGEMFDKHLSHCVQCNSSVCDKCPVVMTSSPGITAAGTVPLTSQGTDGEQEVGPTTQRVNRALPTSAFGNGTVTTALSSEQLDSVRCSHNRTGTHFEVHPHSCTYFLSCTLGEATPFDCNDGSDAPPNLMFSLDKNGCIKCSPFVCDECPHT